MSNEQVIEKIKSLLALATGEGNENEKKLALQRAQELMAKYSVDIGESETKEPEILEIEIVTNEIYPILPVYLTEPLLLAELVNIISQNFGCWGFYCGPKIMIMGFKVNLEISKYAVQVLLRQGILDFRAGYKRERNIGFSRLFWYGFRLGLVQRFTKISNEKALILYDKVKNEFDKKVSYVMMDIEAFNGTGVSDGKKSALDATLNPAVQERRGNLLS